MARFKIYAHYLEDRCIYVGCGDSKRPYDFLRRNENWKTVTNGRRPSVIILDERETEAEALEVEKYHIKRLTDAGHVLANKPVARYWLGKSRDPELIKKMSAASQTPESKEKRYAGRRGRPLSLNHRKAIQEGSTTNKKVKCLETGAVYNSINEAARSAGLTCGRVSEVIAGKRKTAKGLTFALEVQGCYQ